MSIQTSFGNNHLISDLTPKSPLDFRYLLWHPDLTRMQVPGSWFRNSEEYEETMNKAENKQKKEKENRLKQIEQELVDLRREYVSDTPRRGLWKLNAALIKEQRTLSKELGLPEPKAQPLPRVPLKEVVVHSTVKKPRLAAETDKNSFAALYEDDSEFESAV